MILEILQDPILVLFTGVLGLSIFVFIKKLGYFSKIFKRKSGLEKKLAGLEIPSSSGCVIPHTDSGAASLKEKCGGTTSSDSCCRNDTRTIESKSSKPEQQVDTYDKCVIIYGTTTGKSKNFALDLQRKIDGKICETEVLDAADFGKDIEDRMKIILKRKKPLVIIIMSTYTEGTPPESASWFYRWLEDLAGDFRVSHNMFKDLNYAVFGLGNSLYLEHFNTIGKSLDKFLHQLSGMRVMPLCLGDENTSESKNGSIEGDYEEWANNLVQELTQSNLSHSNELKENLESYGDSDEESDEDEDEIMDLEDIGTAIKNRSLKETPVKEKEMVTPLLRKSLTKQGYKIIGTHSGVKLCRWTKSMLRGRGGCYKHTFYGIESHRCMETTPSLACANKCVFCWRHHSNPVGTEWKWKMEDAEFILKGALENHYKMINEFKGVPGVQPDKLLEGMQAKHCALSLVGEPIMYPEINKFVRLLHSKGISSFLVTNAQFPDAIRDMEPCTQLYVSIDASTKESLKKIDRPLFKDFWERFLDSLRELKKKGQRTVYRLTLVKGWNAEEMDNYASLVELGQPDLIEVKGVTFCGSSKASTLTMENVPWHEEVVKFVSSLVSRLPGYEISSEHEHSNCILVSNKKFFIDGVWHTWIDYDKFHELVAKYHETGETFASEDYMAPTPHWAVFGATEQGFDPKETRWKRKGKAEVVTDGGCG